MTGGSEVQYVVLFRSGRKFQKGFFQKNYSFQICRGMFVGMSGLRMPGPVARRDFFLCFGSQLIRPCSPLGRPHLPRGLNHMFYNTTILYVFPYFYTSTFSSQQWACFTDELTLDFVGARLERAAAISRHQGRHPSFDVLWEKESLKRTLCLI